MNSPEPLPVALEDVVEAEEGTLTVLDHHVRVRHTGSQRVIEFRADQIRRLQLDLEVGRPATLAIIPNSGVQGPTVITIKREHFGPLATAVLHLAQDLDDVREQNDSPV